MFSVDLVIVIEELNRLGEKLFEMVKIEEIVLVEMIDFSVMLGLLIDLKKYKIKKSYIRRDIFFIFYFIFLNL